METQKNKKYGVVKILGVALFFSAFFLNASLFVASDAGEHSKASLFLQASADGGESEGALQWSSSTSCGGGRTGSYRVCNVNGANGACTTAGDVDCSCGSNCQ